ASRRAFCGQCGPEHLALVGTGRPTSLRLHLGHTPDAGTTPRGQLAGGIGDRADHISISEGEFTSCDDSTYDQHRLMSVSSNPCLPSASDRTPRNYSRVSPCCSSWSKRRQPDWENCTAALTSP